MPRESFLLYYSVDFPKCPRIEVDPLVFFCSLLCFCFCFFNFYLSLDGHTDDDILLKWRNPTISIANKEMAQFSVGDPTLSTEVNEFSTGKSAR